MLEGERVDIDCDLYGSGERKKKEAMADSWSKS